MAYVQIYTLIQIEYEIYPFLIDIVVDFRFI